MSALGRRLAWCGDVWSSTGAAVSLAWMCMSVDLWLMLFLVVGPVYYLFGRKTKHTGWMHCASIEIS